jgi:hypothetical protein
MCGIPVALQLRQGILMIDALGRAALYYPYVHIRTEHWLKATLLFFPAVKRIVPETYTPEDLPSIIKYTEIEGRAGPLLQAVPSFSSAARAAQSRLLRKLEEHEEEITGKYSRSSAPIPDQYWIHDAKFNHKLLAYLCARQLAWKSFHSEGYGNRNWFALHPVLGRAVMTTLGLSIAREEHYDIVTESGEFHEALLANQEQEVFEVLLKNEATAAKPTAVQAGTDLSQLVITLAGVNYRALRPEDIPELHSSKHFSRFQHLIRKKAREITINDDPDAYVSALKEEANEIVEAWHATRGDLRKDLADTLFQQGITLAGTSAKALFKAPDSTDLAMAGSIAVAQLIYKGLRIVQKHQQARPYQYLTEITESQDKFLRLTYPLGLDS